MFGKKARIRRMKKMRVVVEDITGGFGGGCCRRGGCCSTGMVDKRLENGWVRRGLPLNTSWGFAVGGVSFACK